MTVEKVTAKKWWSWFVSALKQAYEKDALLGKCEKRVRERGLEEYYGKEWTAVMSVLLSNMAQVNHFHQKWEVAGPKTKGFGKIDFAWYGYEGGLGGNVCSQPSVLIEHEQQRYKEKEKGLAWVAQKLVKSDKGKNPGPLRVLITYRWTERYQDDQLKKLVSKGCRKDVPFLLIIGAEDNEELKEWHGYMWRGLRDGFGKTLNFRVPHYQGKLSQKGSENAPP